MVNEKEIQAPNDEDLNTIPLKMLEERALNMEGKLEFEPSELRSDAQDLHKISMENEVSAAGLGRAIYWFHVTSNSAAFAGTTSIIFQIPNSHLISSLVFSLFLFLLGIICGAIYGYVGLSSIRNMSASQAFHGKVLLSNSKIIENVELNRWLDEHFEKQNFKTKYFDIKRIIHERKSKQINKWCRWLSGLSIGFLIIGTLNPMWVAIYKPIIEWSPKIRIYN